MKLRLEPNETREIHKAGYSLYVQSVGDSAEAEIEVSIGGETETLRAGEGIPSNGVMFESVGVKNLENTAVMLDIVIASNNRGLVSNRLSGIVNVTGIVTTTQVPDTTNSLFSVGAFSNVVTAGYRAIFALVNPAGSSVKAYVNHCSIAPQGASVAGVYGRDRLEYNIANPYTAYDFNQAGNPSLASTGGGEVQTISYTPTEILGRFNAQADQGSSLFSGGRPVIIAPGESFIVASHVGDVDLSTVLRWEERPITG